MVDTIKISALPLENSPTSDDIVPMNDGATSTTKKVSFDEFGKAINYSNSISTNTENLLAVDGSNKLLLGAANELISTDASNTISVGSDGKLKGSASSLSLNENELFVGDASNQPVSTSANDVRQVLGLPTDYIKDNVQYVSSTQVSWEGSCRDSQDLRDFKIVGATTATLAGAAINTTYNLFVAGNTLTDAPVIVWDTGSTPAGYTYYRLVFSIKTDGLGNIIPFEDILDGGNIIEFRYIGIVNDGDTSISNIAELVEFTAPPNSTVRGVIWANTNTSNRSLSYSIDDSIYRIIFGCSTTSSSCRFEFKLNGSSSAYFKSSAGTISTGYSPSIFNVDSYIIERY